MTREEAEKYADNMTYRDAINNLMKAKSIPYRKATFIKVNELLKALEQDPCDELDFVQPHKEVSVNLEVCEDMGEVSDGYHTFNQLYHQRAILFATIVNQNKDKAWKSYKHSDGKYCFDRNGEWFIVGIDTPEGSYTYHYAKEYWDMFDCEELECGKEWDGHTEEDVTRLLSLQNELCTDAISRQAVLRAMWINHRSGGRDVDGDYIEGDYRESLYDDIVSLPPVTPAEKMGQWIDGKCNKCGTHAPYWAMSSTYYCSEYCPKCGVKMGGEQNDKDND